MANAKISQLPAVTSAAGGDLAVAVASGTTSQITVDNLFKNRTMVAPTLGAATATTLNKVTITAPASGSTLTIADGKTLTASNTLIFTGTDSSSVAFGTGGTVAYTANNLSVFAATTSAQLAGVISDETGSGALVFATSPTLTTPTLGVAAATSINKVAITAPATGSTLTIADGKTLTANATLTLAGTDGTTMTFPGTSATIARTDAANSFTGNQTIGGAIIATPDTRTGPGAVSVTTTTTAFVSTGTGDALTLADGTTGQIKTIVYTAEAAGGDTGVLTPANRIGYATITFNNIGDSATLQFVGTGWAILALYGAVKA